MIKNLIGLMAGIALSSSAVARFTPTMEADPSEIGLEGEVLINELQRAFVVSKEQHAEIGGKPICQFTLPSFQEREKQTYRRYIKKYGKFPFICLIFKEAIQKEVDAHVAAGFALSDLYCDTFFRRISSHSSQRSFLRSGFNDVGAAISAVLGLTTASAGLTGGVGAFFGLADGTFRNYDANFLVASDLPGLQNLVRTKQEEYRELVRTKLPSNYPDATIVILRYASYCSFTGMKGLLNTSITESSSPEISRQKMIEAVSSFNAMTEDIKARTAEEIAKRKASHDAATKEPPATGEAGTAPVSGDASADPAPPMPDSGQSDGSSADTTSANAPSSLPSPPQ